MDEKLQRIAELIMQKQAMENPVREPLTVPQDVPVQTYGNIYDMIRNMDWTPAPDTGNNNFYTVMGLKPRK